MGSELKMPKTINCILFVALCTLASAFDLNRIPPIERSNETGNKDNNTDAMNQIPIRYDGTQLWRIFNMPESTGISSPIADTLEEKFGGIVWKENTKFMDISFDKEHLNDAKSFLTANNISTKVLTENVQELIEAAELQGALATQSENGARFARATRSGLNWRDYHDLDVIYGFMREIRAKFPNICRLYSIGKTAEGRDLKVLRISENPREYKKIWIDGGIHAREWISPATVTFILHQLMSNWENQPDYIREKTWYIMPVMNPDGYDYSRKVNRLWRKNRSRANGSRCYGVDLNRNFDIGWRGYGSSTNPCSDTYRGASPASEAETAAVTQFLTKRKHNLEAYLTFHSYGQLLVFPWAYKAAKVKDASELQNVANIAVERIEEKTKARYRAGVTHSLLGVAGGGSDDWSRAALGTKYVYTVELRDRGLAGFVLPPDQILDSGLEGMIVVETVAQAIK